MGVEPSAWTPELLAAYRAAHYVVPLGPRVCRLRIGEPPPEPMRQWLAEHGPSGWLSAFNPGSRALPLLENLRRHQALFRRLRVEGFDAVAGYATYPAGHWPDEASLLVPGIGRDCLNRLALDFGQIAFLSLVPGEPPRMWLAHPDGPAADPPGTGDG